jgi:hypothetical protein
MDYLNDLLRSFSVRTKRKLSILSESENPDAINLAQRAIEDAKANQYTTKNVRQAPGSITPVYIFTTAKGPIRWSNSATQNPDGTLTVAGFMKDTQKNFNELVGYFDIEGSPTKKKEKNAGAEAGAQILDSELANENAQTAQEVSTLFQEMSALIPNVISNLTKKFYDKFKVQFGRDKVTADRMGNYVFGASPQSLELQLVSKISRITRVGDQYVEVPDQLNPELVLNTAKNLRKLIDLASRSNLGEGDTATRNFILHTFAKGSDGSVTIFDDFSSEDGVVFKDSTGFLKTLLDSLGDKDKLNLKVKTLHIQEDDVRNTGEANNIRGTLFEEILPWVALTGLYNKNKSLGIESKELKKAISFVYANLSDKIKKLRTFAESWTLRFEKEVMTTEEKGLYDELVKYAGDDSLTLLKAMIGSSRGALTSRGANFFIPVGAITGNGQRADVLECYSDPTEAVEKLKKYGVGDPVNSGLIVKTSLKELISSGAINKDLANLALKAGVFNKDAPIYFSNVSLKNYKRIIELKAGTLTSGSLRESLLNNPRTNGFLVEGAALAGARSIDDVVEYGESLERIYQGIDPLGKMTTSKNGKTIKINSLKDLVSSTIGILRGQFDFQDLFGDKAILEGSSEAKLIADLKKFDDSGAEGQEKKYAMDKCKHNLITYLKNKKIEHGVKNGDKKAISYLMTKLWATAGCSKETLVDSRELESGKSFSFMQNDVVKDVMSSIKNNDGRWILQISGNHFHFTSRDNPGARVTLSDKVTKRGERYGSTSMVHFSRKTIETFDILNKNTQK